MRRVVVMVLAGAMLLAGCIGGGDNDDISFNGMEYQPPVNAPDFTLTDQNGNDVSLSDYEGKVIVVAFTYTHCPDICPVIESNMKYMKGELGDSYGEDVVYLSITIDPLRDTPEVLANYVTNNGYDWPHLTSTDYELITGVWNGWGVAVNTSMIDQHINGGMNMSDDDHDMGGSDMMHSLITMMPDNSTAEYQVNGTHLPENATGWNLTMMGFNMNNISFTAPESQYGHYMENISGVEAPSDNSWWWNLYAWNGTDSSWEESQMGVDSMQLSHHPHLAWVASNANISNLPSPTIPECNGHGWVMGEGSGAHCMCDDGYQWDGDDRMTCVSGDGQGTHSETAQETYDVGHSTVTFILDKEGKKRVAWVGSDWSADEFLEDILALI
ncbi:MAG TPA: SCO family protein [Candidatus Thalassarchaeaceae archaeon]|jgi:cytochrome oxidase Cu insertion factor (SCO1/SenC/PrrC family)|nr:SCO family protein [Candidatus Thalassarchaeaceae archaeon]DAC52143.1 MAG TPA: SCO family protein [Candidatus Poseidoniales archaeon]HIH82423.1 SCO family protein [Candidatus Thalassarchaeaceae archaeon]